MDSKTEILARIEQQLKLLREPLVPKVTITQSMAERLDKTLDELVAQRAIDPKRLASFRCAVVQLSRDLEELEKINAGSSK